MGQVMQTRDMQRKCRDVHGRQTENSAGYDVLECSIFSTKEM